MKKLLVVLGFISGMSVAAGAEPVNRNQAYEVLVPGNETQSARKNPAGLEGRVVCGYQGWFRAEGDGSSLGYHHYEKKGKFEPGHCTIDLWPDLSEFDEDEKYPTPFRHADGSVANVFSSLNPKTVDRHFRWMKEYHLDGVFVQRFASLGAKEHGDYKLLKADNEKLLLCRDAANQNDRCYALMYDLSGIDDGDFERLAVDWKQLRTRMHLGTDPNDRAYLQFNGKPLVAIWGVGFNDDREYGLEMVEWFIRLLKHNPEWGGMSIMLGVPYGWREQERDATRDERLHEVLALADVISPGSVGRYHSKDLDSGEIVTHQDADRKWCEERSTSYLPVLYPGFSWKNLHGGELDSIPREDGKFLWKQFVAAKAAGNRSAYIAMFDEIDEATAIFKCSNDPPVGESEFLTYKGLPSDHYLWLSGEGRRLLNGEIPARLQTRDLLP